VSKIVGQLVRWITEKWQELEESDIREDFIRKNGATHACPKCNKWEHEGTIIYTEIYCDQTDKRTCTNCGYVWRSHFCPAGHVWLKGYEWNGEEFVKGE